MPFPLGPSSAAIDRVEGRAQKSHDQARRLLVNPAQVFNRAFRFQRARLEDLRTEVGGEALRIGKKRTARTGRVDTDLGLARFGQRADAGCQQGSENEEWNASPNQLHGGSPWWMRNCIWRRSARREFSDTVHAISACGWRPSRTVVTPGRSCRTEGITSTQLS